MVFIGHTIPSIFTTLGSNTIVFLIVRATCSDKVSLQIPGESGMYVGKLDDPLRVCPRGKVKLTNWTGS